MGKDGSGKGPINDPVRERERQGEGENRSGIGD
jgi:hypothetical protein